MPFFNQSQVKGGKTMPRKFLLLLLALTLPLTIFFSTQSTYAALPDTPIDAPYSNVPFSDPHNMPEWAFRPDTSCSLTIHASVSQTGAEQEGTYVEGQTIPEDAFPLQGAVYSVWRIGDVEQLVIENTLGMYVCHMSEEFLQLARSFSDISLCELYMDGEAFYPVSDLQDSMDAVINEDEDALVRLVSETGTAMTPTDEDGNTRADGLSVGLYILAMTEVPEDTGAQILRGQAPSLVLLPQLNPAAYVGEGEVRDPENLWLYDICIYPKNQALKSGKKILLPDSSCTSDDRETGSTISYASYINLPILAMTEVPEDTGAQILRGQAPSLVLLPQLNPAAYVGEGEVRDPENLWLYDICIYPKNQALKSGKKILLPDSSCTSDDRETGSTISYASYINLPVLGDGGNFDHISMEDNMSNGLSQAEIKQVAYGPWVPEESLTGQSFDSLHELTRDADYSFSPGPHGFSLELTGQGLNKVNQFSANAGLYVIYDTALDETAPVGTAGAAVNESVWTVSTDRTAAFYTLPPSQTSLTAYGIYLHKKGLNDASRACFEIRRGTQLLFFTQTDAGVYTVSGTDPGNGLISSLHPAPDGQLLLLGLDSESYTFEETATEPGHSLLALPFTVTLTGRFGLGGPLEKAELTIGQKSPIPLSLSESNTGIAELSITNEGVIAPLKTGDNSYIFVAAYIMVFGLLLLTALLIKKRRMNRTAGGTDSEGTSV